MTVSQGNLIMSSNVEWRSDPDPARELTIFP